MGLPPAELLIADGSELTAPNVATRRLPDWQFDAESATKLQAKQFGIGDLKGCGCDDLPLAVAAAGALLQYVQQTQRSALPHITGLIAERNDEFIRMDAATRRDLEISETINCDEAPSFFSLLNTAITGMGSRMLRDCLHWALRDHNLIQQRLHASHALQDSVAAIHSVLADWADIERIVTRFALGTARPRDLAVLRDALASVSTL